MLATQSPPNNQQLVYLIFAREVGPLVKAKYPQIQKVQFNKILGRIWNEMPGSERDKYHQKAEVQLKMQKVSDFQTNIKEEPNTEKAVVSNTCAPANTIYPSDGLEKRDNTLNKISGTNGQSEMVDSDLPHSTTQPGSTETMGGKEKHSSMTLEVMKQYPMFPMYYKNMYPTLRKIYAGKTEEEIKMIAFTMFQEMVMTDKNKKSVNDSSAAVTNVSSESSQQEAELNKIVAVESVSESCEKTENFLLRDEETTPITPHLSLEEASKGESLQNTSLSDTNPVKISKTIDYDITSIKEEPADEMQLLAEQDVGLKEPEVPLEEATGTDKDQVDEPVEESTSSDGSLENAEELEIAIEGTPIIGNPEQADDTNISVEAEAIFTDVVVDNSEASSDGLPTASLVSTNFDTERIAIESVESLAKNATDDELSLAISTITESSEPINEGGEGEEESEVHESKQKDSDARVIFHNLGFFIKNEQNDTNFNEDDDNDHEKTDLATETVVETSNSEVLCNNVEELADEEQSSEDLNRKGLSEEEAISEELTEKVSDEDEEIEEDIVEDEEGNEKDDALNVNLSTAKDSPITSTEKTDPLKISSVHEENSPSKSIPSSQQAISKDAPVALQYDYHKTIVKEEPKSNESSSDKKNPSEPINPGKDNMLKPSFVALPKAIARPEQKTNITSDMKSLIDKLVSKRTPDKDVIRQMVVRTRANMKPAEKPGSALNYRKTPNSTSTPPTATEDSTSTTPSQTLFCYCRSPSSKDLIGCDYCPEWFHPTCLGLSKYELRMVLSLSNWKCPECIKKANGVKKAVKDRIDASRAAFKNKSSPNIHAPSPPSKTIKLTPPENRNAEKMVNVKNDLEKQGEKEKSKCDTCHILVNEVKRRGAVIERLEKRIAELESRK